MEQRNDGEIQWLRTQLEQTRERADRSSFYIREKVNQLLDLLGTLPLRPEELDDVHLVEMDPIGIVAESFAQVLEHLRETNQKLNLANEEIQAIFNSARVGILVLDEHLTATTCNSTFRELFDLTCRDCSPRHCRELLGCTDCPTPNCVAARIAATGEPVHQVDWMRGDRHFSIAGAPVFTETGELYRIILIYSDITERKKAEEEIHQLAYYDSLTGLPNRALLYDRLGHVIKQAARDQRLVAVMILDLDRFKWINDTMGHAMGDQLLSVIARRLESSLRISDTVSRLGGDEFVILLSAVSHEEYVASVVRKLLEVVGQPMILNRQEVFSTGSIGIALYPFDGEDVETLLKHADVAMYQAKEEGKNTYRFFSREMNMKSAERLMLENSLRRALERQEFFLCYHPILDARSGQIVSCEALIRWQHPDLGLLGPDRFISLAEDTGLIIPIGEWVMLTACLQQREWQEAGFTLRVAVNISACQFRKGNLLRTVERVLRQTGTEPRHLELELTESTIMQDPENARAVLSKLKELGVHLAIDDFGTGYSSLNYLKNFPIDRLKIPREFVRDITTNDSDATIAKAIIGLGRSLNMRVVAEGVERLEQLEFLTAHECDDLQGFYFTRPVSAHEFTAYLSTFKRPSPQRTP